MDNPLAKRFREFIQTPGHARTISALVILIIAAAVPLTVLVAQQHQNTQQHAALTCSGKIGPSCNGSVCEYKASMISNSTTLCGAGNTPCCVYEWDGGGSGCLNNCQPVTPTPTAPPPAVTPTPPPGGGGCVPGTGSNPASCGGSISGPMCNGSICHTQGYYCSSGMCTYGWLGGYATTGCNPACGTTATASPSPTCAPNTVKCISSTQPQQCSADGSTWNNLTACNSTQTCVNGACIASTTTPLTGNASPYCGVGANPTNTSGNDINVSSTYFIWNRPTNTSDQVQISYTAKNASGGTDFTGTYDVGTANSFVAPQPVGTHYGVNFTQCSGINQSGTGYSCGFTNGDTVTWTLTDLTTKQSFTQQPFTAAVCPPVTTAPTCGTLTANPSSVNVNGTSNLSISCQNATSYTWSSTCGNVNNVSNSSTTWTAPSNGPTSCTITVNATNSTGTTPSSASINVTVPNCNGSSAGVGVADCSQAVCQATQVNACGVGSGSETCVFNTYNVNSNVCNPQNIPAQSCSATCANGVACYNGACQVPTPTPTSSPAPTPTGTPVPGDTYLALNIGMDAIGSVGDNENPNPSSSNQNPQHPQRNVEVWVFDSNNNQVSDKLGSINYNAGSGIFTGSVDLGQPFATGNYTVKVKSDGHLRRLIPGIQNITSGQTIQLPQVNLVAGDINGDNAINITDYNILLSCINDPNIANIDNHALCNSNPSYIINSDLDDNGVVNEFDYNLFLREYSVQNGN